jgi:8-oxo-dGTP pyrophosphatase MutT (NUDIX family)
MKAKAAVIRLTNEYGEVLLLQRVKEPNGWCFPGGKLNPDENSRDAATREMEEETGLMIVNTTFVGTCKSVTGIYVDIYDAYIDIELYQSYVSGIKPITLNASEHIAYGWFKGLRENSLNYAGNTWNFYKKEKLRKVRVVIV